MDGGFTVSQTLDFLTLQWAIEGPGLNAGLESGPKAEEADRNFPVTTSTVDFGA